MLVGCGGGPSHRVGLRPGWGVGRGVDSYIKVTGVIVVPLMG